MKTATRVILFWIILIGMLVGALALLFYPPMGIAIFIVVGILMFIRSSINK